MKDELEDLAGHRLRALIIIEENKRRVAKWNDKKVKAKEFADGDLVWKLIIPIGTKKFEIWEMVSQLGRSLSDKSFCSWQCIYFRDSRKS